MPDLVAVPDHDRSRMSYKLGYALRHPGRVFRYARRRSRDAWLGLEVARSCQLLPGGDALGCRPQPPRARSAARRHESWLKIGQMQFDYLLGHGLQAGDADAGDRLRQPAGRPLFIDYLGPGNYLRHRHLPRHPAGRPADRSSTYGLQAKLPHLTLVSDLKLEFLPDGQVRRRARAQRLLALAARGDRRVPGARRPDHDARRHLRLHLRPDRGHRASGPAGGLLLPDRDPGRTSPTGTASRRSFMADWEELPHAQSKIRITRRT